MKSLKYYLFLTIIMLLVSCNLFDSFKQNHTSSTSEVISTNISFDDYASINEDLETEFYVDDDIPDFNDYLILDSELVLDYEVVSSFDEKTTFDEVGVFDVEFKLYLDNEKSVSYVLQITVNEKSNTNETNYRSRLIYLLVHIYNSEYLRYQTINDVTYNYNNETKHIQIDSDYEYYFNQLNWNSLFHINQEQNLNGEIDRIEWYLYLDTNNINIYTKSFETNYEWLNQVMSMEDYLDESSILGDKTINDLLVGITDVYTIEEDNVSKTFQIPLTPNNFSISMAADIVDTIDILELYDIESEELYTILSNHYDLITLRIKTDYDVNNIIEFEYDYTSLLNYLLDDDNSQQINSVESAVYRETNIDTTSFELAIPIDALYDEVKDTSTVLVDVDASIVDSLVDEQNNQVYYTLSDSKFLYAYNYETHQIKSIQFDLFPEHIYLRYGRVYVTLFGGEHKYSWPEEEQYGAFAVVDAEKLEIENVFDIKFDPGDIVVDKYNIVYIIHGSNQHTLIESFSPISGMKIDSIGNVYFDGTLLYSDYTDCIYEADNNTTNNNFEIFSLDRGIFTPHRQGNDGFDNHSLKVSGDGTKIYSGNGIVYELTKFIEQDTEITQNIGFEFYQVAFNDTDALIYYSKENVIATYSSNELQYVMVYSGNSDALHYSDGRVFNVFEDYIEILAPRSNDEIVSEIIVNDVGVDVYFDPTQYINTVTGGLYELGLISNNLDTSTVGTYEVKYDVTKIGDVEVDRELILYVNVIDDVGPEITINDDGASINVGESYSPAGCTAIDNVDGEVTCELVESKVNSNKLGDYEVIYKATDSKGNTSYKTVNITVEPINLDYNVSPINLTADVTDVVLDIERNAFYYIDYENKKLVKYSLLDNSTTEIVFDKQPEHMLKDENKLYVTILMGEHSINWWDEDQIGKIAIVDLDTFTLTNTFDINIDPYSIHIYNDYLYIGPGSGQWSNIHAYNKDTLEYLGKSCRIYGKQDLKIDQNTGYLYESRNEYPKGIKKYEVNGSECLGTYSTQNDEEFEYGDKIFISPYQDYLFTSIGTYFAYAEYESKPEMNYESDLGFEFRGMDFNTTTDLVY